jgi:hypothetical protein
MPSGACSETGGAVFAESGKVALPRKIAAAGREHGIRRLAAAVIL